MIDLFAFLAVAAAAVFGWRRGSVNMALWAMGLVGGYVASLLLFRPLGSFLAANTGLPLLAYPVAGMAVLLLTSSLVNGLARRFRKERAFKIENGWAPPVSDRLLGVVLGGAYGGAVVLIVAWAASSLGGLFGGGAPAVRSSLVGRTSVPAVQQAVRVAARIMLGDPLVSSAVARMLADPAGSIEAINVGLDDPRLRELAESESILEAIRSGEAGNLIRNPTIAALAADETFVTTLRHFGALERGSGPVSAETLAEAITTQAGPALRSVEALRNDEEIQEILSGGPARTALDSRDYASLIRSDKVARVAERLLEELRGEGR